MKTCYTKLTELVLLDGKTWKFRALPFNEETLALAEELKGDGAAAALLKAIRLSLSFEHEASEVDAAVATGAVPGPGREEFKAIIEAMGL
jgi:hypothetical protein